MNLSRWRDVWAHFSGRGTYPHELSALLLFPLRSLILSPAELVRRLHLKPGDRVLELGPGPGFFSIAVAGGLADGSLVLVDIQREMLCKARARLRRARRENTRFAQAGAEALPFRDASFDVAFLVTVLGEVPQPPACIAELARVLRPGGLLSVTELPGDPDALTREQVGQLAAAAGFQPFETQPAWSGFTANYRLSSGSQP